MPELFGVEAVKYIEAANSGKLADVATLDDNKYIFTDNDLTQTTSPYNMLLKSARFGTKGLLLVSQYLELQLCLSCSPVHYWLLVYRLYQCDIHSNQVIDLILCHCRVVFIHFRNITIPH